MNVAITSRSQKSADEAVSHLRKIEQGEIIGIQSDVRDPKSQQNAVDVLMKKWGKLDVLVANAGLGYFSSVEELTIEQWQETIDTGVVAMIAAEVSHLIACCASFEAQPRAESSPAVGTSQSVIAGMLHPSTVLVAQGDPSYTRRAS